ncbi:DNA primase small subunit-like [Ornithodoros turicata]
MGPSVDVEMDNDYNPKYFTDYLPVYYKRLFPSSLFYKWLTYGGVDKTIGTNREISFTLEGDVYIRFQSFAEQSEFEKALRDKVPHKIDIGAVYNLDPQTRRMEASFSPREKELVFDIDMSDYNDVRTCCEGAEICPNCWPFMTIAMKILDRSLREDFGFNHILWIYSGRRGVHCWVCDESVRKLGTAARSAIANYLSVVKCGSQKTKRVCLFKSIHPSIKAALKIIESMFHDLMIEKQKTLENNKFWQSVVEQCSEKATKEDIEQHVLKALSAEDRWNAFKNVVERAKRKSWKCTYLVEEVMLELCYPRLDIAVTKGFNHLLKAPFCVHPKTGRVCVPVDINKVDSFDPFKVPTLCRLCNEIDIYDAQHKVPEDENKVVSNEYKKTGLVPSINTFKKFVDDLSVEWRQQRLELSDKTGSF